MIRPLAVVLLGLAGCGGGSPAPAACPAEPAAIETALAAAPAAVRLPGGARISDCVMQASNDAALESVGAALTQVADELARRAAHDRASALRLGYLAGAVRRGAARSNGVAAELAHHVDLAAGASAGVPALLHEGMVAGGQSG